jgi:hypothetical protein
MADIETKEKIKQLENSIDDIKIQMQDGNRSFLFFLNLMYSLCKQFVAWYEKEIKCKQ